MGEVMKVWLSCYLVLLSNDSKTRLQDSRTFVTWPRCILHIIIVSLKGVALVWGNYRGLKFLDQLMKVLERVAENFLRQQVRIDDMQFGFMPRRITTYVIFIAFQLQEKFYAANKTVHGLCRSGKGIRSYTQTCHLVGISQARHWWMAGAAHTEHAWKHQK